MDFHISLIILLSHLKILYHINQLCQLKKEKKYQDRVDSCVVILRQAVSLQEDHRLRRFKETGQLARKGSGDRFLFYQVIEFEFLILSQ